MSDKSFKLAEANTLTAEACPAAILAGGQSSRFGSDKALVEVAGGPLLLSLRETLVRQGHDVLIVADRADRYQQLKLNCLIDHTENCGPLSGLATALAHRLQRGAGWLLLLSCDQACWHPEWFVALAQQAVGSGQLSICDAVHFVTVEPSGEQNIEPLPSLLHTRLLPLVLQRLERRELSLNKLLASVSTVGVATESNPKQWSFNTPQEFQRIRKSGFSA